MSLKLALTSPCTVEICRNCKCGMPDVHRPDLAETQTLLLPNVLRNNECSLCCEVKLFSRVFFGS